MYIILATARKYIPGYTSTGEWTNVRSTFVKQMGGAIRP